jgi:hypothetical protein
MSGLGQSRHFDRLSRFRFGSSNGHRPIGSACPFGATCGIKRRSKQERYSITSSARKRIEVGNVTPIALAVLRFTVNA